MEFEAPVQSVLAVPMKSGGRVIGIMASFCKHIDAFTSDDKELLELLAAYASIAIDNADLVGKALELPTVAKSCGRWLPRELPRCIP